MVAGLAKDMGISARGYIYNPSPEEQGEGYNASVWIALADDDAAMLRFTEATGHSEGWLPIRPREGLPTWTDGFASVLPVLKPLSGEH